MSASPAKKPTTPTHLQPAFLAAFVEATQETLVVQCGVKAASGNHLAVGVAEEDGAEVVVVGGMVGADVDCSICFGFSREVGTHLISAMLQKKVALSDSQIMEGMAELVRIIGHQAKKKLNEKGYQVAAIFPRLVLDGSDMKVWADPLREGVVIPFQTVRGDRFALQIL